MRIAFHDFELDAERFRLDRGGRPVALRPKVFDLLIHLAENRHRVVPREELVRRLWNETAVGAGSLSGLVNELRRALGESGQASKTLRTVHARGYQFVAPVREIGLAGARTERFRRALSGVPDGPVMPSDLLRRITSRLAGVENEGVRGFWIEGISGTGKTRLLDELVVWSVHRGFAVHRIDCEAVRRLGGQVAESIRDAIVETHGPDGLWTARTVPPVDDILTASIPGASRAPRSASALHGRSGIESRQYEDRFLTALVAAVKRLATVRPVVWAIDGLDRLDEAAAQGGEAVKAERWLRRFLAGFAATTPCAVVVTSRHFLDDASDVRPSARVEVFRLCPLEPRTLAERFEAEGLPPLPLPLAEALIRYAASPEAPVDLIERWLAAHRMAMEDEWLPNRRVRRVEQNSRALSERAERAG